VDYVPIKTDIANICTDEIIVAMGICFCLGSIVFQQENKNCALVMLL